MSKIIYFILAIAIAIGIVTSHTASAVPIDPSRMDSKATYTAVVSSGVTPITLVPAVADKVIVPFKFSIRNADTAYHTVLILSNTTTIFPIEMPPGGSAFIDNDLGAIVTIRSQALKFSIDGSNTANLVTVSGIGLIGNQ